MHGTILSEGRSGVNDLSAPPGAISCQSFGRRMFYFFYNCLLFFARPLYLLGALFLPALRRFRSSRTAGLEKLSAFLKRRGSTADIVWLHAASVGEFDQALALAREIQARERPDVPTPAVILSVFSLSVRASEHPDLDLIFYLPLDFPGTWNKILREFRPRFFATMTWDVWPNLLRALREHGVPAYLCSAALAPGSPRLRPPFVRWLAPVYANFTGIGAVDEVNRQFFLKLLPDENRVLSTGDTRYDTILYKIAHTGLDPEQRKSLQRLKAGRTLLVLASTYAADDRELFPALAEWLRRHPDTAIFIFPHHIDEHRLSECVSLARQAGLEPERFSALSNDKIPGPERAPRLVLVDRLGILALAYRFGDMAYVGGGFHHRIHNTAEPAALGLPVITGPRIDTSPIALALEAAGALRRVRGEAARVAEGWLSDPRARKRAGTIAAETVTSRAGAARKFYDAFLR